MVQKTPIYVKQRSVFFVSSCFSGVRAGVESEGGFAGKPLKGTAKNVSTKHSAEKSAKPMDAFVN